MDSGFIKSVNKRFPGTRQEVKAEGQIMPELFITIIMRYTKFTSAYHLSPVTKRAENSTLLTYSPGFTGAQLCNTKPYPLCLAGLFYMIKVSVKPGSYKL